MPEPASSRSLEDILASIRKSLAEPSVDGLVELSAAAVDAARAEQAIRPAHATVAEVSEADALADDLLRDKLAGALVLETETGEAEAAAQDQAASEVAETQGADGDAYAKLWVLRPGMEKAEPAGGPSRTLTLDPFAGAQPTATSTSRTDFSMSPLELLGEAKALSKPLPSMPPLPQATVAPDDAPKPPRLDADSIALLKKLRQSNAAAIEKIAKETEADAEAERVEPAVAAVEASSEPEAASAASVAPAIDESIAPLLAVEDPVAPVSEVEVAAEPADARPLLSMPQRSTPLFGAQEDTRPQVTSGLEQLLAEQIVVVAPAVAEPEADAAPVEVEEPEAASLAAVEVEAVQVVEEAIVVAEPEVAAHVDEAAGAETLEQAQDAAVAPLSDPVAAEEPLPMEAEAGAPQIEPPAGNKALEDMIAAVLEPVLQRLIETSIGPALEALVRREVERALKEQRAAE